MFATDWNDGFDVGRRHRFGNQDPRHHAWCLQKRQSSVIGQVLVWKRLDFFHFTDGFVGTARMTQVLMTHRWIQCSDSAGHKVFFNLVCETRHQNFRFCILIAWHFEFFVSSDDEINSSLDHLICPAIYRDHIIYFVKVNKCLNFTFAQITHCDWYISCTWLCK